MKLTLLATALAAFTAGAIADNCVPGLFYCGSTLVGKGNYQGQIDQAIHDAGQPEIDNGANDLFYCVGGDSGVIDWQRLCTSGCIDAGAGNSDHC
ncbi:hypothetical protein FQN54_004983 [Arachnomyces sp. PD_36]|nr:hypothetical protein FQN54_004983 [Arachnomyces sp. PD_36]